MAPTRTCEGSNTSVWNGLPVMSISAYFMIVVYVPDADHIDTDMHRMENDKPGIRWHKHANNNG